MNNKIDVKVTLKRRVSQKTFYKIKDIWNLTWNKYGQCLMGSVYENRIASLRRFCRFHGMKFEINNEFGKRSGDYRDTFFKHYRSRTYSLAAALVRNWDTDRGYGYYYCAYCGKKTDLKKITVDHIYPVAKVNASTKLQRKLKKLGYENVNDYRNLTPACAKCNKKKGTKLNWWYICRGRLGQHQTLMAVMKNVNRGLLSIACMFVIMTILISSKGFEAGEAAVKLPEWIAWIEMVGHNILNWMVTEGAADLQKALTCIGETVNKGLVRLLGVH